mmetsp:Transcript_11933/g.13144  ORF Transcript_11933/g.13144 Transcript_11933/m.13144 type:complete len:359 (+) Transcript_11933:35-1111(+)
MIKTKRIGFMALLLVVLTSCVVKKVTISNVEPKKDVNGNIINAHEGVIHRWKPRGRFYFYAMSYDKCNVSEISCRPGTCGSREDHNVSIYSSPDMSQNSWRFEGHALDTTNRPGGVYFRTYVFYNEKTAEYVVWSLLGHALDGISGTYIVAASKTPTGPFHLVHSSTNMTHGVTGHGDFYGFKDEDGSAYIVYNTHGQIAVDKLTDDYYASTQKGTDFFPIQPGEAKFQEAPLMFKRSGVYYVTHGHGCCICLEGADAHLWTAKSPLGPYKYMTNIGSLPNGASRTQTQQAFMSPIDTANGTVYLWAGDRWQQAPDKLHAHDPQLWQPLEFYESESGPSVRNLKTVDELKEFDLYLDV